MDFRKLSEKKWYNGAVIVCIGVILYVLLTHLGSVLGFLGRILSCFRPVILAVVFAYVINPPAKVFYYRLFRRMKVGRGRWCLSVLLAFALARFAVFLLLLMLVPQLIQSLRLFSGNLTNYRSLLAGWLETGPLKSTGLSNRFDILTQNALNSISGFVQTNLGDIVSVAANSGKHVLSTVISLILAIYLLIDKHRVLAGTTRLLNLMFSREMSAEVIDFVLRCDTILVSFLVQSFLDALLIAALNAIFMAACRMQYIGLISVVVGVTNLIPNFGPPIGAVIGAFVLLLVNPEHALAFLLFCVVLQLADGYLIKPRLFSNSLGVSGLTMLIAGVVLGNLCGVLGVLLSIPGAAILSFVYQDYFVPRQERRRQRRTHGHGNTD